MFTRTVVPILLFALLIQACSPPPNPTAPAQPTALATMQAATQPAATSRPTTEPTATVSPTAAPQPTRGPTATVWPPKFEYWTLQDIRDLDSFIVTVDEKNTVNGQLTELTNTIGYVKEPYSAYNHNQYTGGMDRTYAVDGWTYSLTGSGDWYISAGSNDDLFARADIPAANTARLSDAQFAGLEDYEGIPAYHFVLDPVTTTNADTKTQLEGEFYIAKDGNYVLFSHWMETSSQGDFLQVFEVTQSLTSINQPVEIQLPADMQEMAVAAQLPATMGLPLPGNSAINQMIRYKNGIGVDLYYSTNPKMSIDAVLDFYRQLPPTNGWDVMHIGHVNLHEDTCEFTRECVILNKAGTQVILYYNGASIRAEFDWPHLFAPIKTTGRSPDRRETM